MDPAFPDLVAATAAEKADPKKLPSPPGKQGAIRQPIAEDVLRLLARLW